MGSSQFAVPSLSALIDAGHEIPIVFTQPNRRAGRGGHEHRTPVAESASNLGIELYQPKTLNCEEVTSKLKSIEADICVIIAYGLKVPANQLNLPKYGFINAHASLLPKYRGAAPVPNAILNNEKETGATIFKLEKDWDTGPIYSYIKTDILSSDTTVTVLDRLSKLASTEIVSVISKIENSTIQPVAQQHSVASKAPKFTRDDGLISWSKSATEIDCMVRAFQPWPEAFMYVPGKRGKVQRITVLEVEEMPFTEDAIPGTVLAADSKLGFIIATGSNPLKLKMIKPEGKRLMTGTEYLMGARIEKGCLLDSDNIDG